MAQLKQYEELVDSIPMPNDDREVLRQLLVKVNDSQSVQSTDDVTFNNVEVDGDLNHDGSNAGFFGATPVSQQTAPASLTDNSGGTTDNTVEAVSGSGADAAINNNFAELANAINQLRDVDVNLGLAS